MTELTRPIRRLLGRHDDVPEPQTTHATEPAPGAIRAPDDPAIAVDIPESDPLLAYLQSSSGPVEVAKLELDSPAVSALREAGVALIVPLVSQGELIGTLNLGPRLSEQEYSSDDRRLLAMNPVLQSSGLRVAIRKD